MEREALVFISEQQHLIDEYNRFAMELVTMFKDGRSHTVIAFDDEKTPFLNDLGSEVSMLIDMVNGIVPESVDSNIIHS